MSRTYRQHLPPSDFRDKRRVRPYDRAAAKRATTRELRDALRPLLAEVRR